MFLWFVFANDECVYYYYTDDMSISGTWIFKGYLISQLNWGGGGCDVLSYQSTAADYRLLVADG